MSIRTWNGEALINFKWNTYGKYYYAIIWIGFMALLGCFTVAATIPQRYIDENIQKKISILLNSIWESSTKNPCNKSRTIS